MTTRRLAEILIEEVWSQLLQPALAEAGLNMAQVSRESLRWDAIDVTAYWKDEKDVERQVHCWLIGEWPIFELFAEGAVWKDREGQNGNEGVRKYQIYSLSEAIGKPVRCFLELGGSTETPTVNIPHRDDFVSYLMKLIDMIKQVSLQNHNKEANSIKLSPPPAREDFKKPLFQ